MALSATISFSPPALPNTGIWFANAQAWANYWGQINVDAEFDAVDNAVYVPAVYDAALNPAVQNIGGIDYVLVTKPMFDSLMAKLVALDNSYQALRNELKAAGFLLQSQ